MKKFEITAKKVGAAIAIIAACTASASLATYITEKNIETSVSNSLSFATDTGDTLTLSSSDLSVMLYNFKGTFLATTGVDTTLTGTFMDSDTYENTLTSMSADEHVVVVDKGETDYITYVVINDEDNNYALAWMKNSATGFWVNGYGETVDIISFMRNFVVSVDTTTSQAQTKEVPDMAVVSSSEAEIQDSDTSDTISDEVMDDITVENAASQEASSIQ